MARKRKLPFVVQPRFAPIEAEVGTEESGIFKIKRFGYLTVAEKAFTQAAMADDSGMSSVYALAARIARETGKAQRDVFIDMSEGSKDYLEPFAEDIMAAVAGMASYNEKLALVQSTALLIMRLDEKWTADDTMELHPDIIEGLQALYEDEEAKTIDAFMIEKKEEDQDAAEESGKS